jgi:hypothetical protein
VNLAQRASNNVKSEWRGLRGSKPGERFVQFHDHMREVSPSWVRPLYVVLAVVSFAVGVVLAFIPGPAVVFFALAAALAATQSRWLAERLDAVEIVLRRWLAEYKKRRGRAGHG